MENPEENKNKIENNEVVKPVVETQAEKEISPEEFSEFLDVEEKNFKQETQEEIKNLNSIGLDEPTFEQAKTESGVEGELRGVDKELENVVSEWKKLVDHKFDENNFYRIVSQKGYDDFVENGIVRSSPTGTDSHMFGRFDIGHRRTSFPSFAKGNPDFSYLKEDTDNFIFESNRPMYKTGDENPVTGNPIKGRHWAYRSIDENGKTSKEIKSEDIKNIYKVDKDENLYLKNDKDK